MLLEGEEKTETRRTLKKRVLVVGRKLLGIVDSRVVENGRTVDEKEMMWECVYYMGHVLRIVRNG